MVWDDLGRDAESANKYDRDKWIGVYIGILAVILAICSLGGGNASKEATLRNIEVTNNWAFFQAKHLRRHILRIEIESLKLRLATEKALAESDKSLIDAKIAEYAAQEALLTSDEKKGEGLDQLYIKGKSLEAIRDLAQRRDPYFDYAGVLLQIAIVLASVSIVSGATSLLIMSAGLAFGGSLLTFNGFTLLVAVPFMG